MVRVAASVSAFALLTGLAVAADLPQLPTVPPPAVIAAPTPIAFNWSGFYFGGHGGYGFGQAPFVDGAVAGGQVGVNWQHDAFVLGAEADGSWVDWQGANAVGTLRLRGGLAFDRFLVYATGGASFDANAVGWAAGTGLQYAFTNNWTGGVEYLYYEVDGGASDVFRGRVSYLFGAFGGAATAMTSPTPAAFNWTGFYLGGHGGYSFVSGPGITDGYEVGAQVGVNRQFGQFVVGIETSGGFVDWGPVTGAGSVRARGGYAFNRFLTYATGGMGIEDSIGWTVGAGVEYALTDHWIIGAEYLHHDFIGGHKADVLTGRVSYMFNQVGGL
jgi:outer membrane immunogenic protein